MGSSRYSAKNEYSHLIYSFISKGKRDIIKLALYQKLPNRFETTRGMMEMYNLAFGNKIGNAYEIGDIEKFMKGTIYDGIVFYPK